MELLLGTGLLVVVKLEELLPELLAVELGGLDVATTLNDMGWLLYKSNVKCSSYCSHNLNRFACTGCCIATTR